MNAAMNFKQKIWLLPIQEQNSDEKCEEIRHAHLQKAEFTEV